MGRGGRERESGRPREGPLRLVSERILREYLPGEPAGFRGWASFGKPVSVKGGVCSEFTCIFIDHR